MKEDPSCPNLNIDRMLGSVHSIGSMQPQSWLLKKLADFVANFHGRLPLFRAGVEVTKKAGIFSPLSGALFISLCTELFYSFESVGEYSSKFPFSALKVPTALLVFFPAQSSLIRYIIHPCWFSTNAMQ